jgi:hypothetical protein
MIIDAWMQHFGESQLTHPMFASLRRWTRQSFAPSDARDDHRRDG